MNFKGHIIDQKMLKLYEKGQKVEFLDLIPAFCWNFLFGLWLNVPLILIRTLKTVLL